MNKREKASLTVLAVCLLFGVIMLNGVIHPNAQTVSAASDYSVEYVIQNDWGTGANVSVTIKNNGSTAINGWNLAWTFPGNQKISNLWNGSFTQSGSSVTVTNMSYNVTIPANGGTVSFGFGLSYSGSNAKPGSFTLNGTGTTDPTPTVTVSNPPTTAPTISATVVPTPTPTQINQNGRQMEKLDRGVAAVKVSNG
ncbi:MAG TPA: cellulose binding domain-containing protein, partial [Bacillota bacterium]|nr:cellulose binding domain-containing protein [Bacillota bacterium]